MAASTAKKVVLHLRRTAYLYPGMGLTDAELLELYVHRHDEAAFESLVRRHGPMVLGVCRRVLRNEADAEDAFQATFLVLVRKAVSIRSPGAVASWLYGVAYQTALKAKAMNHRRRTKEREAGAVPRHEATEEVWRVLQAQLDQELTSLPENYRLAIVLCDLEGKTIKDAAQQLGWPQGTMATRLARGRAALAKRLRDQGLVLSAGVLTAALSGGVASARVPPALLQATVQATSLWATGSAAAAGIVSAKVLALSEGVVQAMFITKLKSFLVASVIALAIVGMGSGLLSHGTFAQDTGGGANSSTLDTANQAKLDDDPIKLKKEIERLRAELARTKLELQIAKQQLAIAAAQAELAKAQAEVERLKATGGARVPPPPPLPTLPKTGVFPKPKPKSDSSSTPTAVSADGKRLAVAAHETVNMIDVATGKVLFKSQGHDHSISTLAFSPDGKLLLSCGRDKTTVTAIVWDAATGKQLHKFQGSGSVSAWQFSNDGRRIIVNEGNGTLDGYDLQTGHAIRKSNVVK